MPGARLSLIEFPADDPERARRFWEGLLDYRLEERVKREGSGRQTRGAGPAVGIHARGPGPGDTASLPYFAVADMALALERVRGLGGSVIHAGGGLVGVSRLRGHAVRARGVGGLILTLRARSRPSARRSRHHVLDDARLDSLARARNMGSPPRGEVSSMCYERYLRRRREADKSHEMWHDFEQTRPVADPDGPPEVTEPERTEAQEEIAIAEH